MAEQKKKVSQMTPEEKAKYKADKKEREERERAERLAILEAQAEKKRQTMGELLYKLIRDMAEMKRGDLKYTLEFQVGIYGSTENWGRPEGFGVRWTISGERDRYITEYDEEYNVQEVYDALTAEGDRIQESNRMRKLAEDVKSRLSPEEYAALKKFG